MSVTIAGVAYLQMQDAIYVSDLQAGMDAYAGYVAGSWPTYETVVAAFPAAKHLSISPFSSMAADCLDIEAGDATNDEAAAWLHGWRPTNTPLPVLYTSIGNAAELIADLAAAGWARSKYLLWSAHYAGFQHVCGPGVCTTDGHTPSPQADATQWADLGPYDISILTSGFFGPATPQPPPTPPPTKENEPVAILAVASTTNAEIAADTSWYLEAGTRVQVFDAAYFVKTFGNPTPFSANQISGWRLLPDPAAAG